MTDTLIGGATEFRAAEMRPHDPLELGVRLVVVKRGPEGATIVDRDGERHIPGLPVPVTNGLGAGDAFAAAFGAALAGGLDAATAAERGNAAGAIVATRLSCSEAMPRRDELERVLAEHGRA